MQFLLAVYFEIFRYYTKNLALQNYSMGGKISIINTKLTSV